MPSGKQKNQDRDSHLLPDTSPRDSWASPIQPACPESHCVSQAPAGERSALPRVWLDVPFPPAPICWVWDDASQQALGTSSAPQTFSCLAVETAVWCVFSPPRPHPNPDFQVPEPPQGHLKLRLLSMSTRSLLPLPSMDVLDPSHTPVPSLSCPNPSGPSSEGLHVHQSTSGSCWIVAPFSVLLTHQGLGRVDVSVLCGAFNTVAGSAQNLGLLK